LWLDLQNLQIRHREDYRPKACGNFFSLYSIMEVAEQLFVKKNNTLRMILAIASIDP
jgi:hypothetical protein